MRIVRFCDIGRRSHCCQAVAFLSLSNLPYDCCIYWPCAWRKLQVIVVSSKVGIEHQHTYSSNCWCLVNLLHAAQSS